MSRKQGVAVAAYRDERDNDEEDKEYIANPIELDGAPDMSMLIYLEDKNVVHNLKMRYDKDQIYTNMVNILIAVNPYKHVPIYSHDFIKRYSDLSLSRKAPHVYGISEKAYRCLLEKGVNQSLIVCGESGSGKTESAKYLMRHLAFTTQKLQNNNNNNSNNNNNNNKVDDIMIEQQILAANPILESFGNAKTKMNNNSSRFGKFTKLLFDRQSRDEARIVGSTMETYLLEKSRVVHQDEGERNFHIFYQLLKGLEDDKLSQLRLNTTPHFSYVRKSDFEIHGVSDKGRFAEFGDALLILGIENNERDWMYRVVAGILHIGNIHFHEDPDTSKAQIRPIDGKHLRVNSMDLNNMSMADDPRPPSKSAKGERRSSLVNIPVGPYNALDIASDLFGVDSKAFSDRLLTKVLKVADQEIIKPLTPEEALFNRDAIAKALYNSLFKWIVQRINQVLHQGNRDDLLWIGILDIFGFETFVHNSFEQFCINFANERLQQFFNVHVVKNEQEEYIREGVQWTPIKVPDHNDTIELIDGTPHGIRCLLDSACLMPKGTHETFTSNLFQTHKRHKCLKRVTALRQDSVQHKKINGFSIRHYAGVVIYDADGFLIKNSDSTDIVTIQLFGNSVDQLTKKLLSNGNEKQSSVVRSRRTFNSVSNVFSKQLKLLITALESTNPFFVRCINPNDTKTPNKFVDEYVLQQLKCGGLMEALRVLKLGYPTRAPYKQIYSRYSKILEKLGGASYNERDFVEGVMFAYDLNPSDYMLGITKVFFRPNRAEYMEKILKDGSPSDDILQKIKAHLIHKRMVRLRGFFKAFSRWSLRLRRIRNGVLFNNNCGKVHILSYVVQRLRRIRAENACITLQSFIRSAIKVCAINRWRAESNAVYILETMWRHYLLSKSLRNELKIRCEASRKRKEVELARQREAKEAEVEKHKQEEAIRLEAERREQLKAIAEEKERIAREKEVERVAKLEAEIRAKVEAEMKEKLEKQKSSAYDTFHITMVAVACSVVVAIGFVVGRNFRKS